MSTSRRQVLAALAASAVGLGCKPSGRARPSGDAPEVSDLKIGVIALTDCSPIVIAHEKGFFAKHGITSTITKGASWAAIRDALSHGDIQATHMLLGMPLASTLGLAGSPKVPMVAPWILNRNGQSITLANRFAGKVGADASALRPLALEAKAKGEPLRLAMTFPPGTHAMWLRYWLAAGGIHPDRDVSLVTVPPPQMIVNMKVGKMDGFCVGEPWGARALAEKVGFTATTTHAIWRDHPEKVCAFRADFAAKNPKTVKAVLKALHEASVWLDDASHQVEQASIVSRPSYINTQIDSDARGMIFSARGCNYPQPKYAKWFLSQFERWGMLDGAVDYEKVATDVLRPDLYEAAMQELGVTHGGRDDRPETLFDGRTFDPKDPKGYAASFDVRGAAKG